MATIDGARVPDELLTAHGVSELMGWKGVGTLNTYRFVAKTFPDPVIKIGTVNLWGRRQVEQWRDARPSAQKAPAKRPPAKKRPPAAKR